MVRLIGAVMTGFVCAYFGFHIGNTLKIRLQSLSDILASLEMLESEINFSKSRLKKAFLRADRNGLFTLAAEGLENYGADKALSRAADKISAKLCLTDADCGILKMLGGVIGRTDSEDQVKNIRYIKSLISAQREMAEEEYKRLGKLYRTGGVLVGVLVVIVAI